MAAEQIDRVKELEEKINQAAIREKALNDELKNVKDELQFVTKSYDFLVNATFSEMFDIATKVKNSSLYKLLEQREAERQKQKPTQ